MPWSEILPQFSLTGTLLTVLLLFFAAIGEPYLGRRAFAWLSRREGDGRALELMYAVTMAIHVLWGVLVLTVLFTSPNLSAVDLGLRLPEAWAPVVGAALGGLIALVVFWLLVNGLPTKERSPVLAKLPEWRARKQRAATSEGGEEGPQGPKGRRAHRGHRGRRAVAAPMRLPEPGRRQYLLLPHTRKERALAAGMAITGGVFGELLYRGLFIVLMASMDVPLWIAAVLSVVLFSLAHLYQGWWGLLSAGFSGTLFTILYLGTGSLLVPVLVHVALNLRSIVFPPASELARAQEAYDDHHDDEYGEYEEGRTGEFEVVDAATEDRNEFVAIRATPPQGTPSGPFQGPRPGPPQGPHQGPPPQGPPQGPSQSPGPHPAPYQGPPLGPPSAPPRVPPRPHSSEGPRQGPPPGAPGTGARTAQRGLSPQPPQPGDFLAPEADRSPRQDSTRWDRP